jgi:Mrp family chromosome partitioning ATPase
MAGGVAVLNSIRPGRGTHTMSRMLETLNQVSLQVPPPPVGAPASVPIEMRSEADDDDSIPYIEVGGPRSTIDASPQVLACPVPARSLPLTPPPAPPPVVGPTKTVQFRPLVRTTQPPELTVRRMAPELIAFHQPDHAVSIEYRTLLADLLRQVPGGRAAVLFTALAPWVGTTTVVLNLGITAARHENRRTVVIEANLRRPAFAERLGLEPAPGWRDFAAGTVPMEHSVQDTAQPYLHALTAGAAGSADHRIASGATAALLHLREQADLVLVDAASWNEGDDVAALAAVCDGVVIVLDPRHAGPNGNVDPLPWLRQPPANLIGCITLQSK